MYSWNNIYFLAQYDSSQEGYIGLIVLAFVYIAMYLFTSFCFYKIYQKLGEPNAWYAWFPILQKWIMYKAGDQSPWWIIALFIPVLNFVALIFLLVAFINVVQKLGKNPWLILLMIIPILNFAIMSYFAFG